MLIFCLISRKKGLEKMWGSPKNHTQVFVSQMLHMNGSSCFCPFYSTSACLGTEDKVVSYLKEAYTKFLSRLLQCVFWSHSSSKCIPLVHLLQGMPSPVWYRWENSTVEVAEKLLYVGCVCSAAGEWSRWRMSFPGENNCILWPWFAGRLFAAHAKSLMRSLNWLLKLSCHKLS